MNITLDKFKVHTTLTGLISRIQVMQPHAMANTTPNGAHRENEGQIVAEWGGAKLIKGLDGRVELKGGSKEEQGEAREWISLFCHEVVA